MNQKIYTLFLGTLFSCSIWAQAHIVSDECKDRQIFDSYLKKNNHLANSSLNSLLVQTAMFFLDTPYNASTLETNEEEQLVVNLQTFDCMTFVENCMALSRTIHLKDANFDTYKKELQAIRYRNGIIDGYTSRLHYISDWITNNQKMGILEDKTQLLGGIVLPTHINFMSVNAQKYDYLSKHPEAVEKMRQIEDSINSRTYYFIPKEKIKDYEKQIKSGDIICFVTSIQGLDVSHLGIVYRKNGILTFIHASTTAKKVIINPISIADYCKSIKSNKGIIVCRLTHHQG
ncbi:MAG: DUF1460 domain-containing protein [Dysgonamonadaceae bacterium]|jgi:cell wall-associated NlpC family hydrolase|nr:DUF1460 domain-containing protein [Dysgonamonadaceae bacterium]